MSSSDTNRTWRFLSNHTQVLLCIARDPEIRVRDIALSVGITERATQRLVSDLIEADTSSASASVGETATWSIPTSRCDMTPKPITRSVNS